MRSQAEPGNVRSRAAFSEKCQKTCLFVSSSARSVKKLVFSFPLQREVSKNLSFRFVSCIERQSSPYFRASSIGDEG
jgi:hypothetical protein